MNRQNKFGADIFMTTSNLTFNFHPSYIDRSKKFPTLTQQLISDIHHYDQRLAAALSNLESDKNVPDTNHKKIKQFLEYIRAEGLSTPRQVRYTYVLRKLSSLLGKEFRRTTKTN